MPKGGKTRSEAIDPAFRQGLANRLRQARDAISLTRAQMAEKLDVTEEVIYRWERGQSAPRIDRLATLTNVYGITVEWLLSGEKDARALKECAARYLAGPDWDEFTSEEKQALQTVVHAFADQARRRRSNN